MQIKWLPLKITDYHVIPLHLIGNKRDGLFSFTLVHFVVVTFINVAFNIMSFKKIRKGPRSFKTHFNCTAWKRYQKYNKDKVCMNSIHSKVLKHHPIIGVHLVKFQKWLFQAGAYSHSPLSSLTDYIIGVAFIRSLVCLFVLCSLT